MCQQLLKDPKMLNRTLLTPHNSTRPCRRNPSAINRIHTLSVTHGGVPPCPPSILNSPLRIALPARVRINVIPNALAPLCFHTLTHSFAPRKTLTPAFSIISALFAQNTRGGVCRTSHFSLLSIHPPPLSAHHLFGLKPVPQRAHPYLCTCKKGPAARDPRC